MVRVRARTVFKIPHSAIFKHSIITRNSSLADPGRTCTPALRLSSGAIRINMRLGETSMGGSTRKPIFMEHYPTVVVVLPPFSLALCCEKGWRVEVDNFVGFKTLHAY